MELIETIRPQFSGEIATDEQTRRLYRTDASAFELVPSAVFFPKTVPDIALLVRVVEAYALEHPDNHPTLTMRSAGTDMTGGPLSESWVVDVNKHLNRFISMNGNSATCEPGMFYRDFEKETLAHHLYFPSYPASKGLCSVGGIVCNNSGGEHSLRYGKTDQHVLLIDMMLRDGNVYTFSRLSRKEVEAKKQQTNLEGELYRDVTKLIEEHDDAIAAAKPHVTKNSMGYLLWNVWNKKDDTFDLGQLFIGAQGTLGVLTKATLELVPVEPVKHMVALYLYDMSHLGDVVNDLMKLNPISLESFDDKTLWLAIRYAPQLARLIGKEQSLLKFGWELMPDFWIMAKHFGLPKLVIMAEFTGKTKEEVEAQRAEAVLIAKKWKMDIHVPKTVEEEDKYWVIRRQSFNLLRKKIHDKQTVPFIDDIIVPYASMVEFLPKLSTILNDYPQLIYTIAGHAGDGNFHIIPLMDMTDEKQRALIPIISKRVYDLVLSFQGSLSGEHNEGLIRGPYDKQMFGEEIFGYFKQLKRMFDPENIFNPHKKTDADMEYSMSHVKTTNEHLV